MNCAKCAVDKNQGWRNLKGGNVKLLKIGATADEEKFCCPNCRAIFWFPKDAAGEQLSFNRQLIPA